MATSQSEWTERLSVKNPTIDSQHQALFEIVWKFEKAVEKQDSEELKALFEELYNYTDYHFAEEENMFRKTAFPQIDEHVKEHKFFLREVLQFKRYFKQPDPSTLSDLLVFFKKWLTDHIMVEDQKYADYL